MAKETPAMRRFPSSGIGGKEASRPTLLRDITAEKEERLDLQDAELNRVLGGGLVKGSLVLIGGEPGIGKSTLVLQTVLKLSDRKVLYVSGEESASQIALRAQRLLPPVSAQAFLLSNSSVREKAHAFLSELMEGLKPHLPEFPGLNCGPVISDKIEKRRNRYHFHVQVLSRDRNELSAFLTLAQRRADIMGRRSDVRFACDVDPLFMY